MKAMILAAGLGKRLQPLTLDTPKPLLKIGRRSLLEDQINRLSDAGVSKFIINISYLGEQIRHSLQDHPLRDQIKIIEEPFPYGTGGALVNALGELGREPFILCNADIFSYIDLRKLPDSTEHAHLIGVPNPTHNLEGDFSIENRQVILKPNQNAITWSGISLVNPSILEGHLHLNFPFDIWNTVMAPLIKDSKITAHLDKSMWIDIGTVERLELARAAVKEEN